MKKNIQKIAFLALFFILISVAFYVQSMALFSRDKVSSKTFELGEQCDYYDRIPDNKESDLPANRCLFEGGETGYQFPLDVDAFVSQLIAKDYPEYRRVDSWISIVETAYAVVNLESVLRRPMVKVVWLCSSPETQELTTRSSVLSLCSAAPDPLGNGYKSSVGFYEFSKVGSEFTGRRIYEESASVQGNGATSVLMSVEFSLFSGKLLAKIEKHFLNGEREAKKNSTLLVYRDRAFKPFFEFESFSSDDNASLCGDDKAFTCQPLLRWLKMPTKILPDGGTVFLVEGRGYEGRFRQATKEIPFKFTAENWTLVAQPPSPSDSNPSH